jgi:hypothetical protein
MSIKSVTLLRFYFLLHVSVTYEHHLAFINSKMHPRSLLDCVSNGAITVSLVMYKFLLRITILKYLSKSTNLILKLLPFSKNYPTICRGFYGWNGVGRMVTCFQTLSFMVTWVIYECSLLVLMVSCVLFWVKMGYFEFLILWYNVDYYASMRC